MIQGNDRVFIGGKTGSGKTYLARRLLANVERLAVIDPNDQLGDWVPRPSPADKLRRRKGRRRFVPPVGAPAEWYDELLIGLYNEGDLVIYIDELYAVAPPGAKQPGALQTLYTRGRARGVGVWGSSQRPTWVPLYTLSECEHFFIFQLHLAEDRKRLAAFAGPDVEQVPPDIHGFYYYSVRDGETVYVSDAADLEPEPAKMSKNV